MFLQAVPTYCAVGFFFFILPQLQSLMCKAQKAPEELQPNVSVLRLRIAFTSRRQQTDNMSTQRFVSFTGILPISHHCIVLHWVTSRIDPELMLSLDFLVLQNNMKRLSYLV